MEPKIKSCGFEYVYFLRKYYPGIIVSELSKTEIGVNLDPSVPWQRHLDYAELIEDERLFAFDIIRQLRARVDIEGGEDAGICAGEQVLMGAEATVTPKVYIDAIIVQIEKLEEHLSGDSLHNVTRNLERRDADRAIKTRHAQWMPYCPGNDAMLSEFVETEG